MKRVGVLISGRGTNLQALLDASKGGTLGGTVAVVVSNRPDAAGLERAAVAGVPTALCPSAGRTRAQHEADLQRVLRPFSVELLCLAGYMRLLSPEFVRGFGAPILNVHPALLPSFPGLHGTRQALEHGVKVTGATVHLVDEGLDSGPIVAQEAVEVRDDDDEVTLGARIRAAEHRIFPLAVRRMLSVSHRVVGRRLLWEGR